MVNTYNLVNPYVKGKFNTKTKAKNSLEAAKAIYNGLSEHFNNNIPKFHFSIQKGKSGNGKLYHFVVKENKEGENVQFSIEPYTVKNVTSTNKKFQKRLTNFKGEFDKKYGGAKRNSKKKKKKRRKKSKKDSSSSESESDSDHDEEYLYSTYVSTIDQPLFYWWYDPFVYSVDSIFVPTFYTYTTPYIHLLTIED